LSSFNLFKLSKKKPKKGFELDLEQVC